MVTLYQDIYATNGTQTAFNFEYQIINGEDLAVYFNPIAGSPVSNTEFKDSMIVTNYNVTVSSLPTIGGSITFPMPPASGGALLIKRNIADDLSSDFANPGTLNGAALDALFLRIKLLFEQLGFDADQFALHYNRLSPVSSDMITTVGVLEDGQSWCRVGSSIVGFDVQDDPGAGLLRVQLESQQEEDDGARRVGYADNFLGQLTVHDAIALLNGLIQTNTPAIGDYKFSDQPADHGYWKLCNGRAISRTSFAAYFGVVGTLYGPGDGTTTFNIFGGGKFLMSANTTYPAGTTGGSTTAALTAENNGPHTHTTNLWQGNYPISGGSGPEFGAGDPRAAEATSSSGSGTPFSILNPYSALNLFVYVGPPTA